MIKEEYESLKVGDKVIVISTVRKNISWSRHVDISRLELVEVLKENKTSFTLTNKMVVMLSKYGRVSVRAESVGISSFNKEIWRNLRASQIEEIFRYYSLLEHELFKKFENDFSYYLSTLNKNAGYRIMNKVLKSHYNKTIRR